MSQEKLEFLARSREFWNPKKTQDWQDMGVDLVIDRRESISESPRAHALNCRTLEIFAALPL